MACWEVLPQFHFIRLTCGRAMNHFFFVLEATLAV